jgi:DNA helicase IV
MAERDKASGMKSAYELALERLERQGIERPREESVTEETRRRLAEVRQQAAAKLAELEILHRDRLKTLYDPAGRQQEDEDYVRERRRIEAERDRKLEKLRAG